MAYSYLYSLSPNAVSNKWQSTEITTKSNPTWYMIRPVKNNYPIKCRFA
ncbi:hypothetical protein SAMN04488023_11292 [Pedobacter rhizosphaerae]|uniref:Uncharacterized protein n=1 Tax=Pedobacter rhizosphaerae TaxID=390241 RepID=A0A1H9QPJ8_9SPHI|nr:hypothetical protein SAMN04488023_11292 [Pedobacter rhizosphaerae]